MIEPLRPSPTDRILFVNIKNSFNCTDRHSEYYRPSRYEATRKYWRVSKNRISKVNLVIGHVDGIVKEVISPTVWIIMVDLNVRGRNRMTHLILEKISDIL